MNRKQFLATVLGVIAAPFVVKKPETISSNQTLVIRAQNINGEAKNITQWTEYDTPSEEVRKRQDEFYAEFNKFYPEHEKKVQELKFYNGQSESKGASLPDTHHKIPKDLKVIW